MKVSTCIKEGHPVTVFLVSYEETHCFQDPIQFFLINYSLAHEYVNQPTQQTSQNSDNTLRNFTFLSIFDCLLNKHNGHQNGSLYHFIMQFFSNENN